MTANAATAYRYKQLTQSDLFLTLKTIKADDVPLDLIQMLAYVMYMQGANRASEINMEDFFLWLERFDPFDLVKASGLIIGLYTGQKATSSTPKKKADQPSEI